jgi:hypothetical protein
VPLTPEYKAGLEASLADQEQGRQGNFTGYGCRPFGMPLMMIAFYPQEYVIMRRGKSACSGRQGELFRQR